MKKFTLLLLLSFSLNVFSQIRFQKAPDPNFYPERTVVTPITASIAYQGYDEAQAYFGQGEYEIFLDLIDGVLDKPIIVLDGFDPGDTRDISGLYASLSFEGENLADILRAEGYDIVILNAPLYTTDGKDIDGGADYIQRNAMVLVELIQLLNAQKVGNEELVVLGPSMGGLIARYGLSYMEANALEHETRLYISFDSPHRGANIPISLQYLINYFAEELQDPSAQEIVAEVLNSPAAKEMLVDHLLAHLLNGSAYEQDPTKLLPEGAPDFRDAFQSELDNLGFPSQVRNVTMINGTGNGSPVAAPGTEVVNTNLTIDGLTDVDVALNFTPAAGQTNTVTDATLYFIGIPVSSFSALSESPSTSNGVDGAPGGTGSIADALDGGMGNPILIEFLDALQQDLYSFIPTKSSLAIESDNWYGAPDISASPFDNYYVPSTNEPHVTVTTASATFALNEIRGILGIGDQAISGQIDLLENPVEDYIRLSIDPQFSGQEIKGTLYNLSGQKLNTYFQNDGATTTSWEVNLASGMYILHIQTENYSVSKKLIIK